MWLLYMSAFDSLGTKVTHLMAVTWQQSFERTEDCELEAVHQCLPGVILIHDSRPCRTDAHTCTHTHRRRQHKKNWDFNWQINIKKFQLKSCWIRQVTLMWSCLLSAYAGYPLSVDPHTEGIHRLARVLCGIVELWFFLAKLGCRLAPVARHVVFWRAAFTDPRYNIWQICNCDKPVVHCLGLCLCWLFLDFSHGC